jgi:uncharacterized membrane protein YkvA (DUF1232 family)
LNTPGGISPYILAAVDRGGERLRENLIVRTGSLRHPPRMAEIAHFVNHGASKITPMILRGVHKKLPILKVEFAQIDAPNYPHLVDQLEFLTNVIEDFVEGTADEIPFCTISAAAFAVIYKHRDTDIIPDSIPEWGHADDSSVVRAVLIEHERVLAAFAEKIGIPWSKITVNP